MKKISYLIAILLIVVFTILLGNKYIELGWDKQIKGEINILSTYENYDYLKECADKFMEENQKSKINIEKVYDVEYLDKAKEALGGRVDIIQLDSITLDKLSYAMSKFHLSEDIVNTYKNNFTESRVREADIGGEIKGVPLSSRPLVMYVREDLLQEFGYKYSDINTWDDVIRIGEDIYTKSEGKVKLINSTGKDYEDLISVLIMQKLESGESDEKSIVGKVNEFYDILKSKNILNIKDGGEFICRISSINGMRELSLLEEECNWTTSYPPAISAGSNKFYVSEGVNLILLKGNNNYDNEKLSSEFISYVTTNTDIAIKYAKNGAFFPSFLYTYKNKDIEGAIKNFSLRSPLIVMSNIAERAPQISNYDMYKIVKGHFVAY